MARPKKSYQQSPTELPEILTKPEVQGVLRISKRTLEYLVASRELQCFKVGKRAVRFNKSDLVDWIQKQTATK